MATPINMMPMTLPDGRVVQVNRTPGLESALGQTGITSLPGAMPLGAPPGGGGALPPPAQLSVTPGPLPAAPTATLIPEAPAVQAGRIAATTAQHQAGKDLQQVPAGGAMGSALPTPGVPGAPRMVKTTQTQSDTESSGQTQITQGKQIDSGLVSQLGSAFAERDQALGTAERDFAKAQTVQDIEHESAMLDQQDALEERKARRRDIDKMIAEKDAERQRQLQAAEALAVDPTKYSKSKSGWAKALAGIGIALQAGLQRYNEGLTGQKAEPLRGTEIIREAWQDNIANQKLVFEQAKDKASLADNQYKEALALYGTPEAAEQAMVEQQARMTDKWLEHREKQVTDAQQLGAISQLRAELRVDAVKAGIELDASTKDTVTKQSQYSSKSSTATNEQPVGAAGPAEEATRRVRLPDGSYGWAPSEKVAQDINLKTEARNNILGDLDQIDKLLAKGDKAGAGNIARGLASKVAVARQQGAMSGDEAVSAEKYFGNVEDLISPRGQARRDAARAQFKGEVASIMGQNVYKDPTLTTPLPAAR